MLVIMGQSDATPPLLDYAASHVKPQRALLRLVVVFGLSAWLMGFLPVVAFTAWDALYRPDREGFLPPILIMLLSLILLPGLGILLASVALMRAFTLYRTPRSWRAAAGAGAIYTVLLAVMGIACSTKKLLDAVGGGDAAFAVFAVSASLTLILFSRWLMRKDD